MKKPLLTAYNKFFSYFRLIRQRQLFLEKRKIKGQQQKINENP